MKLNLLQVAPEPMPPFVLYLLEQYEWLIGLVLLFLLAGSAFLMYRVCRWTLKEVLYSMHTR